MQSRADQDPRHTEGERCLCFVLCLYYIHVWYLHVIICTCTCNALYTLVRCRFMYFHIDVHVGGTVMVLVEVSLRRGGRCFAELHTMCYWCKKQPNHNHHLL